jgi:phosphoribosylglycinamide formyltransferase-1
VNPNFNIAVFASGNGTTLQALIDNQHINGYHVALVVTNRICTAQQRAEDANIPTFLSKDWKKIDNTLRTHHIQMIVLAGYLSIIPQWFCENWEKRIINIHPSLLPKYGGKGMYGIHVHEAVLAAKESVTGCTVHYVSATIDGGEIIAQSIVEVTEIDTPDSLASRVQVAEKLLLPSVICKLATTKS